MLGNWNTVIKTAYYQIYSIFTIKEDDSGGCSLRMETEPFEMNLSFNRVQIEGQTLKAFCIDPKGQFKDIELTFDGDTFSGVLTSSFMGKLSFSGKRGQGESLNDKLRYYGEKSLQENRYWKGKWIWDVNQPEANENLEHKLVFFRRTFNVPKGITPVLKVEITADSRYRLFINGHSVSVGPCKGDQHVQYYETVDVSRFLVPGKNVLAVKVLRYPSLEPFKIGEGGPISVWRSQSAGLFVEASLRDENNIELEPLHSGSEWKAFRHKGYSHVAKPLIQWMGGVEEVNGKDNPQGWVLPQFDDTKWNRSIAFAETRAFAGNLSPWNLVPRPIPQMYETNRTFSQVTKVEGINKSNVEMLLKNGIATNSPITIPANQKYSIELDAGELMTGYLTVGFQKGKGSVIRILSSECYEPNESNPLRGRKKGNREDISGKLIGESDVYYVAGVKENDEFIEEYEPFLFRTFRYVRLEIETKDVPLDLLYFNYRETGYPLEIKAQFESSDEELNTLWDLSVKTLKRCMHETYEDCPYYEQLQYSMDSRLMMLFTYIVSADDRLPRRTIADFYRSKQPSGLLQSRYPSTQPQIIPSFSLYWIDMLAEHYEYNGDLQLIREYRPAVIELLDWFENRLTDQGIIGITSSRYWTYFDWVDEWPLGAPPEGTDRPMYILSLMYANSLRKASYLLGKTGWNEVALEMEGRADNICQAVRELSWSKERQLFRDLPDTEIYSQHTQIMAVLAGAVDGEEAKLLMERTLQEPMHRVTLPFSYLLIQALKKTGLHSRIFDLWDRWRVFLSQGLTTLPETEVNPRSDCHAWSAIPLAEFPTSILGVKPGAPGLKKLSIEPQIEGLTWAKGSVATSLGMVEVDWRLEDNIFYLKAKIPIGVTATVKLPDDSEHMLQDEGNFFINICKEQEIKREI